ncbi:hypothetical protein, partial [Listeria monocytogenes]|uniref:hypothetical protein n=1 Tax=Listeria monocytogenes TaxID=1639 RepID=UPI002FDBA910
ISVSLQRNSIKTNPHFYHQPPTNNNMGLFNPAAIKGLTDELKNKTDNGEVFKQSAIGDGEMVELKLLKPQPNQGGEYNYV